jgi:hypothetical protein
MGRYNNLAFSIHVRVKYVAHVFNPSTWEAEASNFCGFKATRLHREPSMSERLHSETLSYEKKRFMLGLVFCYTSQEPSQRVRPNSVPGKAT